MRLFWSAILLIFASIALGQEPEPVIFESSDAQQVRKKLAQFKSQGKSVRVRSEIITRRGYRGVVGPFSSRETADRLLAKWRQANNAPSSKVITVNRDYFVYTGPLFNRVQWRRAQHSLRSIADHKITLWGPWEIPVRLYKVIEAGEPQTPQAFVFGESTADQLLDDAGKTVNQEVKTFSVGGGLRAEYDGFTHTDRNLDGGAFARLGLNLLWQPTANWEVRLGAKGDIHHYTLEQEQVEQSLVVPDNAHILWRAGGARISVGADTVVWGQVYDGSPIDRLSLVDFSRGMIDPIEDRRHSQPLVRYEQFFGGNKFDFVYIPQFSTAVMPADESPWSPVDFSNGNFVGLEPHPVLAAFIQSGTFAEDKTKKDAYGARWTYAGNSFDMGLTYINAPSALPYYELNPKVLQAFGMSGDVATAIAAGPEGTFFLNHPKFHLGGFDIGVQAFGGVWRLEAAYMSDKPATTSDFAYTTQPGVDWATSMEIYPGDGDHQLNIQVGGGHIFTDDEKEILDLREFYFAGLQWLSHLAHERWRIALRGRYGFAPEDIYINPELAYTGAANWVFSLGYHYFNGAVQSMSGFYHANDFAALRIEYRF